MNPVMIEETTLPLPWYAPGDEDVEPALVAEFTPRRAPVYPYTLSEVIQFEKEERVFEALTLENEFLKLTILPELGGRIYSAFDKVHRQEMFYRNPVIRPGLFAVRGAWPAVGVEFNFPNSHNAQTLEKVQCRTAIHPDGSASVTVGDLELVSRMAWAVTITLHPGVAAIDIETKLCNPTSDPHRFYYWMNAACPVWEESEFIFPPTTRRLLTHPPMDASRLDRLEYPIHRGVDVSRFGNIRQHFPVFAESMHEDFFGIYHHSRNFGVVHHADHRLVRGRKVWTFGCARDGRVFIDQLSDDHLDYCELQTGPFSLQSDYRLLEPGRTLIQRDRWFPVAETGGFNLAGRDFAARFDRAAKSLRFQPVRELGLLTARLLRSGTVVAEQQFHSSPCRMTELRFIDTEACEIEIRDAAGNLLGRSELDTVPADADTPAAPPVTGREYRLGIYAEEQGRVGEAEQRYLAGAPSDPECAVAAARLAAMSGRSGEAEKRLELAQPLPPEGKLLRARLEHAPDSRLAPLLDTEALRDRTLLEIGIGCLRERRFESAVEVLSAMRPTGRGLALLAVAERRLGRDNAAALKQADDAFPFTPVVWAESGSSRAVNGEFVLEAVCEYLNCRLYDEAYRLLDRMPEALPITPCYRAWLADKLGLPVELPDPQAPWEKQFAFRVEEIDILRFVLEHNPADENAAYQLGCLYAGLNRWSEAVPLWESIRGNHRSAAQRNLGLYFWKIAGETASAERCYREAAADAPGGRTFSEFAQFPGVAPETLLPLLEVGAKRFPQDCRVKLALARTLLAAERPAEALAVMENNRFVLCEGKVAARAIFENACFALGNDAMKHRAFDEAARWFLKAADFPENIGIGRPSGNKSARAYRLAAEAFEAAGKPAEARRALEAAMAEGNWIDFEFFPLRDVVWESPAEGIDFDYWINLANRALAAERGGETALAESLNRRIHHFRSHLEAEGRDAAWLEA